MKEKSVTFTKGKSKFVEYKQGKGDFSVENLGFHKKLSSETERISWLTNCRTIWDLWP